MTTYQKAIADARYVLTQHSRRNNKTARLEECLATLKATGSEMGDAHPKIAKVLDCQASVLIALNRPDEAITILKELLDRVPKRSRRRRAETATAKYPYLKRLLSIYEGILTTVDRSQRAAVKQQLVGIVQAHMPVVPSSLAELQLRVGFMKLGMGRDHTINFLDAQSKTPFGDEAADEALYLAVEHFNSDPHGTAYEGIAKRLARKPKRKHWWLRSPGPSVRWLLGNEALHSYFTRETAKGLNPADVRPQSMPQATRAFLKATRFLGRYRLDRIWPLVDEESIWSNVYDGAEETKQLIVEALFNAAFDRPGGGKMPVTDDVRLRLARLPTCLQGFWRDPDLREGYLGRLEKTWAGVDTPRSFAVRGQIAALRQQYDEAEALFMTAEERDTKQTLTGSGHSTFVSPLKVRTEVEDVDDTRYGAIECDFEMRFEDEDDDGGPVIVTSGDPAYFRRYAIPYASSLWSREPRTRIHFHLLGDVGLVENTLLSLGELGGPFSLSNETPPVAKPYYYASARFLRAAEFMRLLNRPLMLTDIDIVFRADTRPCFEQWAAMGDVGMRLFDAVRTRWSLNRKHMVYRYPKLEPWRTLNAGCVYVAPTEGGKWFLDVLAAHTSAVMARFESNPGSNWWVDQNILFAVHIACLRQGRAQQFSLDRTGIPFGGALPVEGELGHPVGIHPGLAPLKA